MSHGASTNAVPPSATTVLTFFSPSRKVHLISGMSLCRSTSQCFGRSSSGG